MELMRKFTEIASPNTDQNLETCGVLAGKLVNIVEQSRKHLLHGS